MKMKIKIKLLPNQNLFFTSDTHYNHNKICSANIETLGTIRMFPSLDEMNQTIIDNINNLVKPDDYLIHCGDVSFGGFDSMKYFLSQINCENIILVLGNHDHHIENNKERIRDRFIQVCDLLDLELWVPLDKSLYENIQGQSPWKKHRYFISHYPIMSWKDMNQGVMHVHGHVHLDSENKIGSNKMIDCGMDGNDLKPYHYSEINRLLKNQPINSPIKNDHHV